MSDYVPAPYASWAPIPDGLVVAAGDWYGVVRGQAACDVRDQLAGGHGVSGASAPLVGRLAEQGVLQRAGTADSSYLALLRAGKAADRPVERELPQAITVQGRDGLGDAIAELLGAELGARRVDVHRDRGFHPCPADRLAVVVAGTEDASELPEVNRAFLKSGTSWILVDSRAVVPVLVGPLFVPEETGCLECLWTRRSSTVIHPNEYGALLRDRTAGAAGPWHRHMVAGLAASLVLGWVLAGDPWLRGACFELSLDEGPAISRHEHLPVPSCPACGGGDA
ncbi:TOMM precursor leader peptide-binding protein [Nonomuraea sp. NPDC005650]|uniref:TOMM precursor leader peptide-binding protein n=1 Tax=Nonomuraea sp. NPDC005650 TaxID=3157045 RepID=UPI00339F9443